MGFWGSVKNAAGKVASGAKTFVLGTDPKDKYDKYVDALKENAIDPRSVMTNKAYGTTEDYLSRVGSNNIMGMSASTINPVDIQRAQVQSYDVSRMTPAEMAAVQAAQQDTSGIAPWQQTQTNLAGHLEQTLAGQTPSVAEMQMRSGLAQALAGQVAAAKSARGVSAGLANRNAANAGTQLQANTNTQAAMLRAQEQQNAVAALSGLSGQAVNQVLSDAELKQQAELANAGWSNTAAQTNAEMMQQAAAQNANLLTDRNKTNAGWVNDSSRAYADTRNQALSQNVAWQNDASKANLNARTQKYATDASERMGYVGQLGDLENAGNQQVLAYETAKLGGVANLGQTALPMARNSPLLGIVGSVGGAVAGGMVGGPQGAMMGSQAGSGLGSIDLSSDRNCKKDIKETSDKDIQEFLDSIGVNSKKQSDNKGKVKVELGDIGVRPYSPNDSPNANKVFLGKISVRPGTQDRWELGKVSVRPKGTSAAPWQVAQDDTILRSDKNSKKDIKETSDKELQSFLDSVGATEKNKQAAWDAAAAASDALLPNDLRIANSMPREEANKFIGFSNMLRSANLAPDKQAPVPKAKKAPAPEQNNEEAARLARLLEAYRASDIIASKNATTDQYYAPLPDQWTPPPGAKGAPVGFDLNKLKPGDLQGAPPWAQPTQQAPTPKDVQEFQDKMKPYSFEYKDPTYAPGEHDGVMVQDLEKSKIGKRLVKVDENGNKAIDVKMGFGAMLAAQADLNKRLKQLEKRG